MPLNPELGLKVIALNLTANQVDRLRSLQELQSTERRRVSLSEVAREVVERGLASYLHAPRSEDIASERDRVA